MPFIKALLVEILRPIIREEFENLKGFILSELSKQQAFRKYDDEAQALIEQMAKASTSEERYAVLQKIKNARPKF